MIRVAKGVGLPKVIMQTSISLMHLVISGALEKKCSLDVTTLPVNGIAYIPVFPWNTMIRLNLKLMRAKPELAEEDLETMSLMVNDNFVPWL